MRQLTNVDAQFLAIEDGRNLGHVCLLAIFDPRSAPDGTLSLDSVTRTVAERIHLLAPFRWRLRRVPFGIAHPFWADDGRFDLDFHIREMALPAPGTDTQLAEQAARIASRPLDRGRPLWELYVIQGLAGGRVALLTKIHHATVDGVSGGELFSVLLDPSPEGRDISPAPAADVERTPRDLELLARGAAGATMEPLRALRNAPRTLANLEDVAMLRALPGVRMVSRIASRVTTPSGRDGGTLERPSLQAPRTPFNAPITPHRRVALASLPLVDVKRIKNAYATTVNDVVVALCTGAIRRWLADHEALPANPLLAMIPVSVRTSEERGTFGNKVSTMVIPIPTNVADPNARLAECHKSLLSAKERHRAVPATLLQDANAFIPPALFARAARVITAASARDALRPPVNVTISNVPGSPAPLYFAGATMEAQYPISAIIDSVGLNITVLSYRNRLDFGLVADREQIPDLPAMASALTAEMDGLLAGLAPKKARRQRATTTPGPRT